MYCVEIGMSKEKFIIKKDAKKLSSINRTIRIQVELFDRLTALSEANGVSFNKIVNLCIEYAMENLED